MVLTEEEKEYRKQHAAKLLAQTDELIKKHKERVERFRKFYKKEDTAHV